MIRYTIVAAGIALAAFAMLHPVPHPAQIAVASATVTPSWTQSAPAHRRHARKRRAMRKRRRYPRARHRRSAFTGTVDVNLASIQQLANVPGIDAAIASRIVAVRQIEGRFTDLDELLDIAGLSSSRFDRAQPYLRL